MKFVLSSQHIFRLIWQYAKLCSGLKEVFRIKFDKMPALAKPIPVYVVGDLCDKSFKNRTQTSEFKAAVTQSNIEKYVIIWSAVNIGI